MSLLWLALRVIIDWVTRLPHSVIILSYSDWPPSIFEVARAMRVSLSVVLESLEALDFLLDFPLLDLRLDFFRDLPFLFDFDLPSKFNFLSERNK